MTTTKNTNHIGQALSRLSQQFKGKPKITAFVTALVAEVQELEDALWQLLTERTLDNSIGVQLDRIGVIVKEQRQGRADEVYRQHLKARIALNRSSGLPEQVLAIVRLLTGPTSVVEYRNESPASFVVRLHSLLLSSGEVVADILKQAPAGGVRVILEWFETEPVFSFDGASGETAGFGDATDPDIGGTFASARG